MPPHGTTYSVNQANAGKWHDGARKFLAHLTSRKDKRTSYSLRYCGAFAADFHRCLLEGGIYMYPGEVAEGGKAKGKLRLMYELAPLSMLAEQAGGRGSTGKQTDSRHRRDRDPRAASDLHRQRGGSRAGRIVQRRRLNLARFPWMDSSWPAMSAEPKLNSGSSSMQRELSNWCASIATRPRISRSLEAVCADFLGAGAAVNAACIGVPGPIIDGRGHATNIAWQLSSASLSRALNGVPVRLHQRSRRDRLRHGPSASPLSLRCCIAPRIHPSTATSQ